MRCATTDAAHDAERGGDRRLLQLRRKLPRTGRQQAPGLGRRTGARRGSPSAPVQSQEVSPPGGGQTAYVNTWALGPLAAERRRRRSSGRSSRSKAGAHTVHFDGRRGPRRQAPRRRSPAGGGGGQRGRFTVQIAPAPPPRTSNPGPARSTRPRTPAKPVVPLEAGRPRRVGRLGRRRTPARARLARCRMPRTATFARR